MEYKNITIREISQFSKEFPNYTLGELLYAGLRLTGAKTINELLNKTDEQIFTAFNTAIEEEKDVAI